MIATDAVTNNLTPVFQQFFQRHSPIERMEKPEETARVVMYLLSGKARYATGQVLAVSGGFGPPTPVFADLASAKSKR